MIRLADLQDGFQRAVLDDEPTILEHLQDSSKQTRDVLFDVYRLGYAGRLVDVLESEYPILARWLGDEFDDLARTYIAAFPSDVHNARWFGRHLAHFLSEYAIDAGTQVTADLASLEAALADAFDATDAPPLEMPDLAAVAPDNWPSLTFSAHPSAHHIYLQSNAEKIWLALQDEADPPDAAMLVEPATFIVWRYELSTRFRVMQADESMMWTEMCKGVNFGVLCEMISMFGGEDGAELRAASYLKGWLDAGLLARDKVDASIMV